MDKVVVFIGYFIFSLVTIKFACLLFGVHNQEKKILYLGLIGGTADYIVKELLVPRFGLFNQINIITGIIVISIACYFILNISISLSLFISVLSYIAGFLTEIISLLFIINIWGKEALSLLENNYLRAIIGLTTLIPLLISIIYIKIKKVNLINLQKDYLRN